MTRKNAGLACLQSELYHTSTTRAKIENRRNHQMPDCSSVLPSRRYVSDRNPRNPSISSKSWPITRRTNNKMIVLTKPLPARSMKASNKDRYSDRRMNPVPPRIWLISSIQSASRIHIGRSSDDPTPKSPRSASSQASRHRLPSFARQHR